MNRIVGFVIAAVLIIVAATGFVWLGSRLGADRLLPWQNTTGIVGNQIPVASAQESPRVEESSTPPAESPNHIRELVVDRLTVREGDVQKQSVERQTVQRQAVKKQTVRRSHVKRQHVEEQYVDYQRVREQEVDHSVVHRQEILRTGKGRSTSVPCLNCPRFEPGGCDQAPCR